MGTRTQYDGAFKHAAVQLLEESGLPLVQVARRLGIHESMLRRWRNQIRERGSEAFDRSGRREVGELERLRRENRRLKRDMEMLKKTLVLLERLKK